MTAEQTAQPPFPAEAIPGPFDSIKPDIIAPGVDIISCSNTGGYTSKTGTSMAAPFVTGAAALLMEWGIVRGNDLYMYGDSLKLSHKRCR